MWKQRIIETSRGSFELFEKGEGEPLAVTHLYSEYNEKGNTFANPFTAHYHVFLINLRGAGKSVEAESEAQYSMKESVLDLEAIREALLLKKWGFAGHSTGGMLALVYATMKQESLTKIICGGAAASKEYAADPGSIYCRENPNFERIVEIMDRLDTPDVPLEERRSLGREWNLMSFHSEEKMDAAVLKPNSGRTVGERLSYFRKVDCKTYDVREALKSVHIPAYIYSGVYDMQCPHKFGVEIANCLPNAYFTSFSESNHYPFAEEEEKFDVFVESTLLKASQTTT
ncbi:proline iminopeptidase [Sporosarcina sp. NCCP-2222]|uniref:alpha/beta fold hydrolase n=1 Tax=Sporosarcina sp. NCCP-2222 TaxID=2935073 RepID=UPI00207E2CCA|nr:alpha/beta hydrolase [Sporosarcina sp. NCCP-2222]GKV57931.1 proline iminopeptidase [Sporosarcina sp. NCCP-2222]